MMQMSAMGKYESQSQLSVQGLWKRGQDAPHRQAEASPKQVRDQVSVLLLERSKVTEN